MFIILQQKGAIRHLTIMHNIQQVNWLSASNQLFKYRSVWLWRQDPLVASYDKQGLAVGLFFQPPEPTRGLNLGSKVYTVLIKLRNAEIILQLMHKKF